MTTTTATTPITFAKQAINGSIFLSVLLILAGVLAIAVPPAAGIAVTILVGWLLIFSGAAHLVFGWYTRTAGGFLWELFLAALYVVVGGYLLFHIQAGLASLTLALSIYLFVKGILEFVLAFVLRPLPGSGWLVFDGILTLILAVLIWRSWPSSSEWVIGTLLGISMLFSGVTRLALSMAARRVVAKIA
jgi:uncharacterized membrane protein HdeD (DUF308 family)